MKTMKYKPTPLNLISGFIFGYSIYTYIIEDFNNPFTFLGLAFGIGLLGVDLIIQLIFKSYKWILLFNFLVLGVFEFYRYSRERTMTLIIPDSFNHKYVIMIYDIPSAPKLPDKFLNWNYSVRVPENGILKTSSTSEDELPQLHMETYSGIKLNSESSKWEFDEPYKTQFDCGGKIFKYKSWFIRNSMDSIYGPDDEVLVLKVQNSICK